MIDEQEPGLELNLLRIAMAGMRDRSLPGIREGPRRLRILHADDHAANRQLVQEILLSAGHLPRSCGGGGEALEQLGHHAFDVVLMDINMPGLDGVAAVRQLRAARGPARTTPVIALTSEIRRNLEDYLALGFDGFVAKPFAIASLLEEIARCAAAAPRPRARLGPHAAPPEHATPASAARGARSRPRAPNAAGRRVADDPWIGGGEAKVVRRIAR